MKQYQIYRCCVRYKFHHNALISTENSPVHD